MQRPDNQESDLLARQKYEQIKLTVSGHTHKSYREWKI